MRPWFVVAGCVLASSLWAAPLTLVNTLPDRPVFNLVADGMTVTRTLAPGNRLALESCVFSGLGQKQIPLSGGVYYLARFGATAGIYRLDARQVLILNQSGVSVSLVLAGERSGSSVLASGGFALAGLSDGKLHVTWSDGENQQTATLEKGGVYRLVLGSEGLGTAVVLSPWELGSTTE